MCGVRRGVQPVTSRGPIPKFRASRRNYSPWRLLVGVGDKG